MIELLKNVAESNGLKVTQTPTLIQISGPALRSRAATPDAAADPCAAAAAQQNQQQQMRLFTYRLKHASAIQLAPVLTNLFSGFSGTTSARRAGHRRSCRTRNGGFTTIGGINSPATADRGRTDHG